MSNYKPERECITKQKSSLPKKKKIYTVEARYLKKKVIDYWSWCHNGDWFVWKKYETEKQRDNALLQFIKQSKMNSVLEFRKGTQ